MRLKGLSLAVSPRIPAIVRKKCTGGHRRRSGCGSSRRKDDVDCHVSFYRPSFVSSAAGRGGGGGGGRNTNARFFSPGLLLRHTHPLPKSHPGRDLTCKRRAKCGHATYAQSSQDETGQSQRNHAACSWLSRRRGMLLCSRRPHGDNDLSLTL